MESAKSSPISQRSSLALALAGDHPTGNVAYHPATTIQAVLQLLRWLLELKNFQKHALLLSKATQVRASREH